MKQQIVVIHGGGVFKTYKAYIAYLKSYKLNFEKIKYGDWKDTLGEKLGKDFEVILLRMPNPSNARYKEWKIAFDKLVPFLRNKLVLVGHSLGGIFLAKYLSENKLSKKILATILVAAPYNIKGSRYALSGFILSESLIRFQKQVDKILIYHSKDDRNVPFSAALKYKKVLPKANFKIFNKKGHFIDKGFPELVRDIKKLF